MLFPNKVSRKQDELKALINQYEALYDATDVNNEQLADARIFSLKVIGDVKTYVNNLAHTPKEYINAVYIPTVKDSSSFSKQYRNIEKDYKNKQKSSTVEALIALGLLIVPFGTPISAFLTGHSAHRSKKHDEDMMNKLDDSIRNVSKEIGRLKKDSANYITESEYLSVTTKSVHTLLDRLRVSEPNDYSLFSDSGKDDLGVMINNVEALIRRLE